MSTIKLQNLTKRFAGAVAVDDLSLDVNDGEFLALLGPSGCGKTTTLRMIAGFVEASHGSISFGDRDVTRLPANKRNTGMVFQSFALFPHLTVARNVAYGLEMRRVPKSELAERVAKVLDRVQLGRFAERYPRQLSGGQQQRVALARALVINPDVLLLDEPLSALDAKLRHDVRIQIRQLQQNLGLTTIFVTHDQEEALSLADRLVVMNNGKIEQVGSPSDLYDRPQTPFVADFIGRTNFFKGTLSDGQFKTPFGVDLQVTGNCPQGSNLIAFRPEKIQMELPGASAPGTNRIAGNIDMVSYLGPYTEYRVKVANDNVIVVHRPNRQSDDEGVFVAGKPVVITVPPERCLLFRN